MDSEYAVRRAERGPRNAEYRTRVSEMPYSEDDGVGRRGVVSLARSPEFEQRNSVCVIRNSELGVRYAESGIRKKAVLMLPDGRLFDIYDDHHHKQGGDFMSQSVKIADKAPAAGLGSGVVDSNRFYSMLLDARATGGVNITESMHDIAERLLKGEKDNSKLALDQLWTLKKTLVDAGADNTVEELISYYQEKIDVLREREEAIKKASKDTRSLIEEKMKQDEELTLVKSQISTCTHDLKDLNAKLETLKKREGELVIAEQRLKREISANETRIVSGLHDIILRRADQNEKISVDSIDIIRQAAADIPRAIGIDEPYEDNYFPDNIVPRKEESAPDLLNRDEDEFSPMNAFSSQEEPFREPIVYPKSVVRMGGKIIGEYYHDGNIVTKDERHYIYNSRFMADRMTVGIRVVKAKFAQDVHAELIKIAEDAANRVNDNKRFHFEVATNEILNDKNLKELSSDLKRRAWDDAERFAHRLSAKIEALGANYDAMLQEQMERCAEIG
ncbi:MAG: hypothetical protein LBC70_04730 [Chitinispirillales bacterium]|nr:hypothetical protein [Chitinispirillales bacterium]